MKLLHVTNIVSPHQIPMARCLAARLGDDNYRYAATMPLALDRLKMGWACGDDDSWILRVSDGAAAQREYQRWWAEADVVLCGERVLKLMATRLKQGGLTFYMSERWWKPPLGKARLAHPRFAAMALQLRRLVSYEAFHYLAIGHYAATDMQRWAHFGNRAWLWGYYTALPPILPDIEERGPGLRILYAGRMLDLKRVDTLIRGFGVLFRKDPRARLTLIGDGPTRQALQSLAQQLGLVKAVSFQSSLPMNQVWQEMQSSHVFVLPSNGREGWGAVVNEAMSQGCTVVASVAAGSAWTVIRHGENGLLFEPGNWRQLGDLLCRLSADEAFRCGLAHAGQQEIAQHWSPEVAADRFLAVCESLLAGASPLAYESGPMAPAGVGRDTQIPS